MKITWRGMGLRIVLASGVLSASIVTFPSATPARRTSREPGLRPGGEATVARLEQRRASAHGDASGREPWLYLDARLYWLRQRAYPKGKIDWTAYARAYARSVRTPRLEFALPEFKRPAWQPVGPKGLPEPYLQYCGKGPVSGRVNAAAYHPVDPDIYYLASAGGGVWKTRDGGLHWQPLSDGPEWVNQRASSLVVDTRHPNVVYVGTGDFDGGHSQHGFGVMKSEDGGGSWTRLGARVMTGFSIRKILIDPDDANRITVITGRNPDQWGKVWQCTDGGAADRWIAILQGEAEWSDLECSALLSGGQRYYYAAGHGYEGGAVWRSANRGKTWDRLHPPLSAGWQGSLDLAVSPTRAETVYLLSGADRRVWKSTRGGDPSDLRNARNTWVDLSSGFPSGNSEDGELYNWSQSEYDFHITCSRDARTGGDLVFVGLIDLVALGGSGTGWTSLGHTYDVDYRADPAMFPEGKPLARTHNDQHCLAVNPRDPGECLVGNDGGIYRMRYDPVTGEGEFTPLNGDLSLTQLYRAAYHPTDSARLLAGSQDNGTPALRGNASEWSNVTRGDGGYCVINSCQPDVQYASEQEMNWLYRTVDNWATREDITFRETVVRDGVERQQNWGGDRREFITPMAVDPNQPSRLYVGTDFLWRYDADQPNRELRWTQRLGGQRLAYHTREGSLGVITAIAVAPGDSQRIYTASDEGEIWMTPDGGLHWKQLNLGKKPLPNLYVTSIVVYPDNRSSILVGLSGVGAKTGHLWRCPSTTASAPVWEDLSGVLGQSDGLPDLPVNGVAIDPRNPSRIYVGTDIGFYTSVSNGGRWANGGADLGLPNVQVNDVQVVPGTNSIMAATFGRGIWRFDLPVDANSPVFRFISPR